MFIVQVDTARVRVDEVEGLLTGRAQASTRVRGVPEKPQEATCGGVGVNLGHLKCSGFYNGYSLQGRHADRFQSILGLLLKAVLFWPFTSCLIGTQGAVLAASNTEAQLNWQYMTHSRSFKWRESVS
jgi:hypothetical protein